MRYSVRVAPEALAEAIAAYQYIRNDSHSAADHWFDTLVEAIDALEHFPRRFRRAPEASFFRRELRQFLHGRHRVIYTIVRREVRVLHIRHAARLPLISS